MCIPRIDKFCYSSQEKNQSSAPFTSMLGSIKHFKEPWLSISAITQIWLFNEAASTGAELDLDLITQAISKLHTTGF